MVEIPTDSFPYVTEISLAHPFLWQGAGEIQSPGHQNCFRYGFTAQLASFDQAEF